MFASQIKMLQTTQAQTTVITAAPVTGILRISYYSKILIAILGKFGEMALAAYSPFPPSHLQSGIDRPPRA